ncbi:hypothetical protein [Microseira wollei]|uniref:Transposase n=1 Tax=Microseira wollei NIES-4236 TaxID=2530354 RepID=A0AAV3XFE9_9CYAN|nr:hypothetical protein [Microseira wollei]GET39134.1 hypothetical protein MiSe_38980 [Microseira wollei NIES-4236]
MFIKPLRSFVANTAGNLPLRKVFRTYAYIPGFSEKSLGKGTRDQGRNRVSGLDLPKSWF